MALIHRAELTPTKLELLTSWLPTRPWYTGTALPDVRRVSAFRLDDPAGEVGVETMLVRSEADGPVLQVPLTYRATPLDGAEAFLIGTTEHSVLGTRYVYDAIGDPVYAAVTATAALTGAGEAEELVETDGRLVPRPALATVRGTGGAATEVAPGPVTSEDADPAVITAGPVTVHVARVLDPAWSPGGECLAGTWEGQDTPVTLVAVFV